MDEKPQEMNNDSVKESSSSPIKLIILLVVMIGLLVGAYIVYNNFKPGAQENNLTGSNSTNNSNSGEYNLEVPDFELKDLDGNNVKLSDYKGKIVVVNFWAVWCKFCVYEMPDFNEINKEYKDKDVVILAVNVQEDKETASNFMKENGYDLKVLLDFDGSVAEKYEVPGFPSTYTIGKNGALVDRRFGVANKAYMKSVLDKIK